MKFEEIYAHMAAEYKTLAGVEPEDAADVSIRLKVLAGELYTVLCAAESLKLNCFPQTAAGEALDLHAEERGLVRKDAVKSVGTLTFSRRTALSYAAEIPAGTVCAASGENAVEYETTEAAVLPAGALTVTAAAQAVLGGRRGNAAKGAVNTLITPPSGIESVTNDVPFTGGADKEDDEALRTRLLRCFYALPNGSNTETYRRAALMTPGVKSVQVVPRANGVNTVAVYLYGDNGAVTDEVLGKVGEKVLSGASLAGQIQYIMTLIFYGVTSGATVLTAQYWGKKDTRTIEKVLGMGLSAGLIVAVVFAGAALGMPETLMRIYTSDPEVIAEGVKYLRIVGFSYVFMAVTQVYLNIMRSIERVMVATFIYLISLLMNIVVNAVLIFGLFGFPVMGVRGAAIGTLCARAAETVMVLVYAIFRNKVVRIRLKDMVKIDKVLLKDFAVYSMPVVLNELMWGLGTSANTAVIGHLGSAAVAANSVAQVARQLATVVTFGISHATAIYLGKTIGEGKMELAKAYGKRFVWLSLILGILGGVLILISAPIANANLALTGPAKNYLSFMFFVMSYFTVAQAFNTTMVVGVFRAGGDTKFGLIMDVSTMWGFSILLGAVAAFILHASVPVVYVILMSDELIKVPITLKRYLTYKWLRDVTREQKELEEM